MNLDFAADVNFIDNKEAVTYFHKERVGGAYETISNAIRTGTHRVEGAETNGVYTKFKSSWLVPASLDTPKPGDTITDAAGRVHTVLMVQQPRFNAFWALGTIDLDIEVAFDDRVTLYNAVFADNNYAQRVTTWLPDGNYAGVPCRIQPNVGHAQFFLAHKSYAYSWTIWCQYIPLTYGDLLRNDATDVYYKIVDFGSVENLQSLMWINVIQNPVP